MNDTPYLTLPDWNQIDALVVEKAPVVVDEHTLVIATQAGDCAIQLNEFGLRLQLGKARNYDYQLLQYQPTPLPLNLVFDSHYSTVTSEQFTLKIQHQPLVFELYQRDKLVLRSSSDGHFVRQYRVPPLAKMPEGWLIALELQAEEAIYGLGEKWGKLDKRGQLIRSYNHDALGVNAEISYKNVPFAWSPNGWGLFVHTPSPVTHAVGFAQWSQRSYCALVEDEFADIFVLVNNSGVKIIDDYTKLTGKASVPPDWSMGLILSKAYYRTADELLETAKLVREQKMPCETITLDGRAWQDTQTRFAFEWDKTRYPDPKLVLDQLKALNFKICIWEYPMISVDNPLFDELAEKGWLIKDSRTGEAFRYDWDMSAFGEVLTPLPKSGILDFTHPDAYQFWLEKHKALFEVGVDMIKADFGEQIESEYMLASNGESGKALHNIYTLLYNRCVYEAASKYAKNGPFLFSRSAWIGSQNYPAQWGGDPQADWGGLAGSIRGGLSWGMSGAPFYATDVGGFYKDTRDDKLFVRWCQAAVFSAHMRLHGIGDRVPWSYSEEANKAATKALKLRHQLLPYIKQTLALSHETGLPAQRAMALAFPEDRAAWAFETQYMFGEDLLVVPCTNANDEVEFYLPKGQWRQLFTDVVLQGQQVYQKTLALDEIAVFINIDKQIPLTDAIEYLGDNTIEQLPIHYWPQ